MSEASTFLTDYVQSGHISQYLSIDAFSNITLPVLPNGLQLMADQGFEHRLPIIVLPKANQQQVPAVMRTWVCFWCEFLQFLTLVPSTFIVFYRTFKSRRSMIERCFGILKNSYSSVGTRRFRSRRWQGPLICNLTAALYNRRRRIFRNFRFACGQIYIS